MHKFGTGARKLWSTITQKFDKEWTSDSWGHCWLCISKDTSTIFHCEALVSQLLDSLWCPSVQSSDDVMQIWCQSHSTAAPGVKQWSPKQLLGTWEGDKGSKCVQHCVVKIVTLGSGQVIRTQLVVFFLFDLQVFFYLFLRACHCFGTWKPKQH